MPELPTIGQIFHIWKTRDGKNQGVTVSWFLKPEQTVHKLMTKFIKNEVFRTNHYENYLDNEIIGRCYVLFIKDYLRGKPEGVSEKDLYICESRYSLDSKSSQKIKNWKLSLPEQIRNVDLALKPHDEPITIQRNCLESELELGIMPAGSKRKRDIEEDHESGPPKRRAAMETPSHRVFLID